MAELMGDDVAHDGSHICLRSIAQPMIVHECLDPLEENIGVRMIPDSMCLSHPVRGSSFGCLTCDDDHEVVINWGQPAAFRGIGVEHGGAFRCIHAVDPCTVH